MTEHQPKAAVTQVVLVYFNAGGGHRAAANALAQAMQGGPWQVRLVNFFDMIDPGQRFARALGMQPEDGYNKLLARGLTLGMAQELKVLQWLIRRSHTALVKRLSSYWLAQRPDMVVSLIPNFNRALCASLAHSLPQVPYVTVLTDMADFPPHFWIEPTQAQHVVCGTDHAVQQALAAGCAAARVHQASGMMLAPRFYQVSPIHRGLERQKHGLTPNSAVGLVLFGGHGSRVMRQIATRLSDTPLILICGKNAALAAELRALPARAPRVVIEFTDNVPYWMQLADFFIGKPGPASLSEAVHMGLPVIVTRNAWTMPQERWNTEWVRQHRLGLVLRSFGSVRSAVDELLRDLPQWQRNVRQLHNQAVFEVPQILASLLTPAAPAGA